MHTKNTLATLTAQSADRRLDELEWDASPIAPGENLKVGTPLTFGGRYRLDVQDEDGCDAICEFDLRFGGPAEYAQLALRTAGGEDAGVTLTLNDKEVAFPDLDEQGIGRSTLWGELEAGKNVLKIRFTPDSATDVSVALRSFSLDEAGLEVVTDHPFPEDWDLRCVGGGELAQPERIGEAGDDVLFDLPRRAVELLGRFDLPEDSQVESATLYVTGPALFEPQINGSVCSDRLLEPGWTDYRKRLSEREFEVTELVKGGANEVRIALGNGWYTGGMGWQQQGRFTDPDGRLWVVAALKVTHSDGSTTSFGSDDTWQWRPSATTSDSLYNGESYDARLQRKQGGWQPVEEFEPPEDLLVTRTSEPPVRVVEELRAREVRQAGPGRYIFDFGQNHTGIPRLKVAGLAEGMRLVVRHAEVLDDDGELYIINLRTARATDTYTARGDETGTWSPRFTYHGFRYAELSGLPEDAEVDESTLISRVVHSDVARAGTFESANPLLARIVDMTTWGIRSNLHSVPTDCPQRDERLGWTGDAQIIADTSNWHFEMESFWDKWLIDLLDSQFEDGGVPNVAPRTVTEGIAMAWADVITVLPWSLHRFYGRREMLERVYPGIRKWLSYLDAHDQDGLTTVTTFGDWVPVAETPRENVASAFAVWSPKLAAKIARVLGREEDANGYEQTAQRRAAAYHEHFFDEKAGEYKPGTQTANVLPLAFGITPEPLQKQVARKLVENVRAHGGKLTSGFIGSPVLLQTLSRFGYHEDAYGIIATEEYPSLGYMLSQNATTVWERWNTDKADPGMNSHNHFAYGCLTAWLFEKLAGINPVDDQPGFAAVRFTPGPVKGLDHASATYQSVQGEVRCGWRREGEELAVEAETPEGVEATLEWPGSDAPRAEGGDVEGDDSTLTWSGGKRRFTGSA